MRLTPDRLLAAGRRPRLRRGSKARVARADEHRGRRRLARRDSGSPRRGLAALDTRRPRPWRRTRILRAPECRSRRSRCALVLDAHQRAVQRHAANERLGAVDRVQDPAIAARAAGLPNSSPRMASSGKCSAMRPRSSCSAWRSATVTGESFGLQFHGQVGVMKVAQRQLAGFAAARGPVRSRAASSARAMLPR